MKFSASDSDALNLHELQHLAPDELKLYCFFRGVEESVGHLKRVLQRAQLIIYS